MSPTSQNRFIGIDLGGTKISGVVLDETGTTCTHCRIATPQNDYAATCEAIKDLVATLDTAGNTQPSPIGIGIPGSCSPATGLIRNANSTCLNGKDLKRDLEQALTRPIHLANDADCFAISEATDGAGADAASVWGLILGTGCGSGIVINSQLHQGPLAVAGEWGHNPLPWPTEDERRTTETCWCGRHGCIETWISGPAISRDHHRATGETFSAADIRSHANLGNAAAKATLQRHLSRTARAMAQVINIIDPDVIVIGGGLSQMPHLVHTLPDAIAPYLFADHTAVDIRSPRWGDDSGVRGAAWLWAKDKLQHDHTRSGT